MADLVKVGSNSTWAVSVHAYAINRFRDLVEYKIKSLGGKNNCEDFQLLFKLPNQDKWLSACILSQGKEYKGVYGCYREEPGETDFENVREYGECLGYIKDSEYSPY